MKKSKKNTPRLRAGTRPRWFCGKCGMLWVNCEPICIICGVVGKPLNEGAEKILNKCGELMAGGDVWTKTKP